MLRASQVLLGILAGRTIPRRDSSGYDFAGQWKARKMQHWLPYI